LFHLASRARATGAAPCRYGPSRGSSPNQHSATVQIYLPIADIPVNIFLIFGMGLAVGFISGMFGMNTAGLPGLEHPFAFWMVCLGMLAVTIATLIFLRAKKWF